MLSDREMLKHLRRLKVTREGINYIMRVRANPPARRVEGRYLLNSPVRYASQRMGHSVQGEAYTTEGAEILECEFDRKNVLEYWDQIEPIVFEGTRKDGRHLRTTHTGDLLVIRKDSVQVWDPKSEEQLEKLCRERPSDWRKIDGEYHHLPVERAYGKLGLIHKVRSSALFNPVRAENLQLLIQSRRAHVKALSKSQHKLALKLIGRQRVMPLAFLARSLKLTDLTPLLRLIDDGKVVANLDSARLSVPSAAYIARNTRDLVAFDRARQTFVVDPPPEGITTQKIIPRDKDHIVAINRLREVSGKVRTSTPTRTLRRWKALFNKYGLKGLIPGFWKSGNTEPRLKGAPRGFVVRCIRAYYATEKRPSERGAYRSYGAAFEKSRRSDIGARPIAFNTFRDVRKQLEQVKIAQLRGGRRAANAAEPPADPNKRALKASRPFQRAHVDHCLCKQWVVVARSEKVTYTLRPWLTLMVDEYDGSTLAMHLGFSRGSRQAIAGVMRDCVRRHRRLPEWIITDQGAEFQSVYYEAWLAETGVSKQERPTSAPRYGAPVERRAGTTGSEVFTGQPGSMRRNQEVRAISASHHGRKTAKGTLEDLYRRLETYYFKHFNKHPHGEALDAPDVLSAEGLARYGCSGIPMDYDFAFIVSTAIPAPRKKYSVDPTRGINVYGIFYRSPELTKSRLEHVESVRIEPFDENRIYVLVKGTWMVAYHAAPAGSSGANPLELMCRSIRHFEGRAAIAAAKRERELDLARQTNQLDRVESKRRQRREGSRQNRNPQRRPRARRTYRNRRIIAPLPMRKRSFS